MAALAEPDAMAQAHNAMAHAHDAMERSPDGDSPRKAADARLHSTVRLNQFTLQFEDAALEAAYKAYTHRRKKALWLRSLIPATAFHVLFGVGDCLEHPADHLLVTVPARVFLSVLQLAMFVLVRWDLVSATESTMLLVSICNGIPTLLLYALQRSSLHQWDALFVVFGLSFYTIPKITPLGFVASLVGSWFTAVLYAALSFLVRPPMRPFESLLGFLYCAPVIGIFNTISYYSEYNSRERFVLRRRLRSESITLAVSRTKTLPSVVSSDRSESFSTSNKFTVGVLLWGAFTLGGWTSLPDMLKFVDEETGWAWFSHCAGLTIFLLVMTRQLQWLFVVPVLGALVLWMLSLAMPASWIIVSAHSVGYGLLLASIVVAMGVFTRFVSVWRELVAFLTRSCFLYPQLQAGLQDEYPLLVKIVSEYTAGMDPEIISSRDSTSRAITAAATSPRSTVSTDITMRSHNASSFQDRLTGAVHGGARSSPRRRLLTAAPIGATESKLPALKSLRDHTFSMDDLTNEMSGTRKVLVEPRCTQLDEEDGAISEHRDANCHKMVSVLPSFKAGKCFFCSKNEAEHLVPACGMWGKWTHWRMSQQQDILYGSLALPSSTGGSGSVGKPVQAMCTSYYDVQQNKADLEQRLEALEKENAVLLDELVVRRNQATEDAAALVRLRAEIRAQEERHTLDMQRQKSSLEEKMNQVMSEANSVAHEHKIEMRELENENKRLFRQLKSASRAAADLRAAQEAQRRESDENERLNVQLEELRKELEAVRSVACAPVPCSDSPQGVAVQPSRRLPYARWIEVEGLRESIKKKVDGTTQEASSWSTSFQ